MEACAGSGVLIYGSEVPDPHSLQYGTGIVKKDLHPLSELLVHKQKLVIGFIFVCVINLYGTS